MLERGGGGEGVEGNARNSGDAGKVGHLYRSRRTHCAGARQALRFSQGGFCDRPFSHGVHNPREEAEEQKRKTEQPVQNMKA